MSTTILIDTRRAVIQAMENISPSQDPETRNHIISVGLKEMIRWFTLAAPVLRWDSKKTAREFNKTPPKKRAVCQASPKRRAVQRSPAKKRPTRKSPVKLKTTRNMGIVYHWFKQHMFPMWHL